MPVYGCYDERSYGDSLYTVELPVTLIVTLVVVTLWIYIWWLVPSRDLIYGSRRYVADVVIPIAVLNSGCTRGYFLPTVAVPFTRVDHRYCRTF